MSVQYVHYVQYEQYVQGTECVEVQTDLITLRLVLCTVISFIQFLLARVVFVPIVCVLTSHQCHQRHNITIRQNK